MHEMSLCQGVVRILEEQAAAHAYKRVKTVRLEVGPLATVEPEALRFCFDAATRGTLAENANARHCHDAARIRLVLLLRRNRHNIRA